MQLERFTYVSESLIDPAGAEAVLAKLVAAARIRNAHMKITGALLFTGTHFAQILEGSPTAIASMLTTLQRDPRHGKMIVTARHDVSSRMFPNWRLAYHGPSRYVARHISRFFGTHSPSHQNRMNERLTQLFLEFLSPDHPDNN